MGSHDNIANEHHWHNLVTKAERGFEHFQWQDFHIMFDPIFYTKQGLDRKGYYRRIFQVPFLRALYGDEPTKTGLFKRDGTPVTLPRFHVIAHRMVDHIMAQDPESILAYMDSLPTAYELSKNKEDDQPL